MSTPLNFSFWCEYSNAWYVTIVEGQRLNFFKEAGLLNTECKIHNDLYFCKKIQKSALFILETVHVENLFGNFLNQALINITEIRFTYQKYHFLKKIRLDWLTVQRPKNHKIQFQTPRKIWREGNKPWEILSNWIEAC